MQPYFNVLVFGTMAPHLTLPEYKNHYDNIHVPLVRNLTGENFPPLHTRYYVGGTPAFVNASAKVDWDSMAVMSFRDQAQAVGVMGGLGRGLGILFESGGGTIRDRVLRLAWR